MSRITLSNGWNKYLLDEFQQSYMQDLLKFVENERKKNKKIFPAPEDVFRALDMVPLENVKVVILGQDPYHGEGQAHGLSFSVGEGVSLPPSLQNIFKELKADVNIERGQRGNLNDWAEQGVLLLNSVLTVEESKAGSHQKKGWEKFTNKIISVVNENCEGVVFILWGAYAQKKAEFVNREKHLVLESVHPSPLSSYRGYFGSKPFSKANSCLKNKGKKEIRW